MSVLTEIMHERAEWGERHTRFSHKVKQYRALFEYALLIVLGLVVYCCHSQLVQIVSGILFE